jgi:S1-C subfamily serine protease
MMVEKEKTGEKGLCLQQSTALAPPVVESGAQLARAPAKFFLREFTRELWREINPLTRTVTLLMTLALVGAVSFFGYLAYRDRQQGRGLIGAQGRRIDDQGKRIDEQNERLTSLKEQVEQSNLQILGLNRADQDINRNLTLAPTLWSAYSSGVCMIAGSYVLIDPGTNKPLRYPESSVEGSETEGLPTADSEHRPTPLGNGPIFELEFIGTGFHVGDGYILTNRHIALQPWLADIRAQFLIPMMGGEPRIQKLAAYFPGHRQPYPLKFIKASQQVDLAVCRRDGKGSSRDITVLPLDRDSAAVAVGKVLVTMGYPSGPDRMLALLPEDEALGLQNKYGASATTLLDQLAKRRLIKPLTTQGHITDLYVNRIVFDATTSAGASGSPIFGQSGRVIGVTFAIFTEDRASNFAVPITSGFTLLESAGWTAERK